MSKCWSVYALKEMNSMNQCQPVNFSWRIGLTFLVSLEVLYIRVVLTESYLMLGSYTWPGRIETNVMLCYALPSLPYYFCLTLPPSPTRNKSSAPSILRLTYSGLRWLVRWWLISGNRKPADNCQRQTRRAKHPREDRHGYALRFTGAENPDSGRETSPSRTSLP